MKKILLVLSSILLLAGCNTLSKYESGIYNGNVIEYDNDIVILTTSKIEIDDNGKITDVTFERYINDGEIFNELENNNIKRQVELLEQAIIDNQGVDFIQLDELGYITSIDNVSIKVNSFKEAFLTALE